MSLESIINQISDGVDAAFDAVEASGGTVPASRTMSNMAAAVETVPEPTPPVEEILYGKVGYYPWTQVWSASGDMCEVTNIDETQLDTFFTEYPPMDQGIDLQYEPEYDQETWEPIGPGTWRYMWEEGDMELTNDQLRTQMGITVTLDDELEVAMLMIEKTYSVDTTADIIYAQFDSEQALLDAGWPDGSGDIEHYVITVGNAQVYNQAIKSYDFGSEVSEFPDFFMNCVYLLDTVDASRATITSVGEHFMNSATFNSPIDFSHCTSIGESFLSYCINFNQPMNVSSATTLGTYFLSNSRSFNSTVTLSPSLTQIPHFFLKDCPSFNQPIQFPSSITYIGNSFLYGCTSFNQPVTIPNTVTAVGEYFMDSCSGFNQSVQLSSSLTSIKQYFLKDCKSFNQPLIIPNTVATIEWGFMLRCQSFNQDITIPASLTSVGEAFMHGCSNMTSTVTWNSTSAPRKNDSSSLATTNQSDPCYATGIAIRGAGASYISTYWPQRHSKSPYRKYSSIIVT